MLVGDPEGREAVEALGPAWHGATVVAVLGSGLGGGSACLEVWAEARFDDIAGLGQCFVPGHEGRVLRGTLRGQEAILFVGRRHLYEGVSMATAAAPARLGAALGARLLVSCSAVGAVEPSLPVGSWVFFEDHVNLMGRNPLEGVRDGSGRTFVDLTHAYRADLSEGLCSRLDARGIAARSGVLAAFPGPTYETPAEVRMAKLLGASVVGMSTVPEVVWARFLGLDVIAWGRVANAAAGVGPQPLDHGAVVRESELGAGEAGIVLEESVSAWIARQRRVGES